MMDHMGLNSVLAREGRAAEVIAEAVALARYPNVSVKMTNLVNASREGYPYRDLNEHLRRVFDAYGPQRCHWGTDITAAFAKATWRQRITHVTEELTFLSEPDKDWLMGRSIRARLNWA
jgi:predicted TIM-barrel fold metal-dependent hydrolase